MKYRFSKSAVRIRSSLRCYSYAYRNGSFLSPVDVKKRADHFISLLSGEDLRIFLERANRKTDGN